MAESSKNFIYLLPDVAYIVELAKSKDDDKELKIRDYLQVNGNFMNDNEILEESIKKLANRIKPKEYELVLPDFLFTNTVVNVDKKGEEKILEHVNKNIIPDLNISEKTHELHSFILNEFKGQAKVQLSALEKTVLNPLKSIFPEGGKLKIGKVLPLSWVTKSLISLEPSISIVQMGTNLYLAQHYIGVDQANNSGVDDVEKLVESIKTLKGAEPSIQTVYLLANALVEGKLKKGLEGILPIQQLAVESEDSEMPSYIKQVIEAAAKTMGVADYKVPSFEFSSVPEEDNKKEEVKKDSKAEEVKKTDEVKKEDVVLPPPTELGTVDGESEIKPEDDKKEEPKEEEKPEEEKKEETGEVKEEEKPAEEKKEEVAEVKEEPKEEEKPEEEKKEETGEVKEEEKPAEDKKLEDKIEEASAEVDLTQFMSEETTDDKKEEKSEDKKEDSKEEIKDDKKDKKVIKNDAGVNSMVKMAFVALVSFFITVGIGLGIGLGFLSFTNKQATTDDQPVQISETTPSPEPTVEPTSEPVDREKYSILVVNATTKAGYAGEIASELEEAGFVSIDAANAKGDYEEGNFILMAEEEAGLLSTLDGDTGLSFKYSENKEIEDPSEDYDFVVVLAE